VDDRLQSCTFLATMSFDCLNVDLNYLANSDISLKASLYNIGKPYYTQDCQILVRIDERVLGSIVGSDRGL